MTRRIDRKLKYQTGAMKARKSCVRSGNLDVAGIGEHFVEKLAPSPSLHQPMGFLHAQMMANSNEPEEYHAYAH